MKRQLFCNKCATERARGNPPADEFDIPEYVKVVYGNLKSNCMICDLCNKDLLLNDRIAAVTYYTDKIPYYQWKHEYLNVPPVPGEK